MVTADSEWLRGNGSEEIPFNAVSSETKCILLPRFREGFHALLLLCDVSENVRPLLTLLTQSNHGEPIVSRSRSRWMGTVRLSYCMRDLPRTKSVRSDAEGKRCLDLRLAAVLGVC